MKSTSNFLGNLLEAIGYTTTLVPLNMERWLIPFYSASSSSSFLLLPKSYSLLFIQSICKCHLSMLVPRGLRLMRVISNRMFVLLISELLSYIHTQCLIRFSFRLVAVNSLISCLLLPEGFFRNTISVQAPKPPNRKFHWFGKYCRLRNKW